MSALVVVVQVVFGDTAAMIWGIAGVVLFLVAWVALPLRTARNGGSGERERQPSGATGENVTGIDS